MAVSGVPKWRTTAPEGKDAGGEPAWGKRRQQRATLLAPCRAGGIRTAPRALGAVPAPKGSQHLQPQAAEAPLPLLAPSLVPKGTKRERGRQAESPAPSRSPRGAPGAVRERVIWQDRHPVHRVRLRNDRSRSQHGPRGGPGASFGSLGTARGGGGAGWQDKRGNKYSRDFSQPLANSRRIILGSFFFFHIVTHILYLYHN